MTQNTNPFLGEVEIVAAPPSNVAQPAFLGTVETNAPAIYAANYGALANTRWTLDGSITNGSPTVTSASIAFTQADVGKTIYTVLPSTGQTKLIGTILSVQSATSCTASANASATQTGCTLCVGTDDSVALQAAWAAALLAGGGTVYLPAGNMLISSQLFYLAGNTAAKVGGAYGVVGQGSKSGGSTFVVSPNFNWAGMQGSGFSAAVIFSYNAQADAITPFQGGYAANFSVTGLGSNFAGSTAGTSFLYGQNGVDFFQISVLSVSGPTNGACLVLGTECRAFSPNIQPQIGSSGPAGPPSCIVLVNGADSIDIYSPILAYTGGWGIEFANNFDVQVFGGLIVGCGGAPGSNPHTCVNVVGSTHVGFHGTVIELGSTGGSTPGNIYIDGTSSVFLEDVHLVGGTTGNTSIWVAAGGVLYALRVNNAVTGSESGINIAGSLFDLGGNNFGQTPTITGSVFGTSSITGTAALAANITPSAGWGTTGAAGNGVSAVSGNTKLIQFTITAAGTPAASPQVTVTFPTAFLVAPICRLTQVGGTNFTDVTNPVVSTGPSTTTVTFTLAGTPVAAHTYTFQLVADLP
jgi:hypothetical protein